MHPLVTTALLGTGQQKLLPISEETPLDSLLATLPEGEQEKALLLQAGSRALYRQAGYRPGFLQSIPEPAETETQPVCSAKKRAALDKIIRETVPHLKNQLLLEALQVLRQDGQILPPEFLPSLLGLRDDSSELHPLLAATCGKRGIWLSQFNPRWHWLYAEHLKQQNSLLADSETIWQTGSTAQRVSLLALLRRIDPGQAREKLQAIWNSERGHIRITMLKTFQVGLSKTDEDFLEACLDDRNPYIRTTASTLLGTLSDSALTLRMQERGAAMLTYQHPNHLELHFVTALTPADERDGLTLLKKTDAITRAGLIFQVLGRVPPKFWETHFSVDISTFIQSAGQTDWAWDLLIAWTNAALLYKAEDWYQPLWNAITAHSSENHPGSNLYAQLATHLPAEFLEAEISRHPVHSEGWQKLLPLLHTPWSRKMAWSFSRSFQEALKQAEEATPNQYQNYYRWNTYLPLAALGWPIDSLDLDSVEFVQHENTNYTLSYMQNYYRNFKRIINIRRSLHND